MEIEPVEERAGAPAHRRRLSTLFRVSTFPTTRMRRLRRTGALRDLVRETTFSLDDLVMPLFVAPEALPNEALPGMSRHTVDGVVRECEELLRLGVRSVILFGIPEEKDDEGSGAWIADGIVQQALRALRPRFPELLLLTDVCLCEYTAHGHCGVLRDGEVDNDASLELLARTAVSHVEAGADAVCPSDMMDGRVAAIRAELPETPIVSYAAKYASAFYGPFREAAGSAPSFGDRRGYQMDPGNVREALRECELDIAEGADVVLVKPALPYLDVVRAVRERFDVPVGAYNVSGEYAMVKAAAAAGHLDERAAAIEIADRDPPRGRRDRDHVLGERARRVASELLNAAPSSGTAPRSSSPAASTRRCGRCARSASTSRSSSAAARAHTSRRPTAGASPTGCSRGGR